LASGGAIKPLRDLTAQLDAHPSSLIHALEQSGFGPHSGKPAGGLWEAFEDAARSSDQADSREPWTLLRDLAIGLSRSDHHAAASALIRGLIQQSQGLKAPPETLIMLRYDLNLIEGQLHQGQFHRQLIDKEEIQPSPAFPVEAALPQPPHPEQPQAAGKQPGRKRRRSLIGISLAATALAGAVLYTGVRPREFPGGDRTLTTQDRAPLPEPEIIPPVGAGGRYSLPYVRYCHFQQERLKTIKELAQGPDDARAYNLLVVDYNARCSDYLYQSQDLVAVVAEVTANKSRIEADAKRIMSAWPGHAGAAEKP
jgi:hypothetical protein